MSSHVSRDYRWPPGPMGSRCSPCSLGSHGSHIAAVSHGAQRQSNHSEFTVFVSPVSRLPRFPGSRGVRVLKVLQLPLVRWALTILGFAVVLRFRGVINVLSALAVLSCSLFARSSVLPSVSSHFAWLAGCTWIPWFVLGLLKVLGGSQPTPRALRTVQVREELRERSNQIIARCASHPECEKLAAP